MKKRSERRVPRSQRKDNLRKPAVFSLALHILLLILFSLSLRATFPKTGTGVYRVSITPFSSPGGGMETPQGSGSPIAQGISSPSENPTEIQVNEKKVETLKKEERGVKKKEKDTIEGLKPSRGDQRKSKESIKKLEQGIEEIRKQAAIDQIRNRVARRQKEDLESAGPSSKGGTGVGGAGVGGSRIGGSGTGPYGTGGSTFGSPSLLDIKLNEYYNEIWAKIKKEWMIPENLSGKKRAWEAIIVLIIDREGRVQKFWFEKRSGNSLYDQMAVRTIKKAEPFPPLPKEWSENTLEIGIRFHPE